MKEEIFQENLKSENFSRPFFLSKPGMICFIIFLFYLFPIFPANGQERGMNEDGLEFIEYPDFPSAHSTWGSIGFNSKLDRVYIGVTNHIDSVGLYDYDVEKNTMVLNGFIGDLAHLRPFQWQGKIHSKLVSDSEGIVYFSTDGGDMRHLDFMDGPLGYTGGFLMKWNPAEEKLTNLGMGLQYDSLKEIALDPETGNIYAVTFPQVHFLIFNKEKNIMIDLGRLGGGHVPRILFTDKWGNCYYVDWRQRLVKFDKKLNKLIFAEESLPAFPGTPGSSIITGITAFAKDIEKNIIYFITYGSKILAFHPQEEGIGKVEDLGGVYNGGTKESWSYYVPNLNLGNNGKLYYFIGGHGRGAIKDTTVFMEFDPKTRNHNALGKYDISELEEATGSDIKDKEGNLYFAGRKTVSDDSISFLNNSIPFLIKFNPEKIDQ